MTTTLRPEGPPEPTPDGGRTRAYSIRVNGRDAGRVVLAAGPGRPAAGRIVRLHVAPEERRRGRGTVAALAAEEVLRAWGCAGAEAAVPAGEAAALRLAAALGWRERVRTFSADLAAAPWDDPGTPVSAGLPARPPGADGPADGAAFTEALRAAVRAARAAGTATLALDLPADDPHAARLAAAHGLRAAVHHFYKPLS
ncbi:GNAT family N-acetyltransferase [Streptomyces sp. RFCAC02]|uniref:GNAT family N-acetyltransferase n=1 Tax=Streptomyces sp. RFCAC02 TaxID=2499143 RepID=UPI00101ECD29|nr:GNAT family N-acetyltransferase [Streptomyces sp. RFCAC02]